MNYNLHHIIVGLIGLMMLVSCSQGKNKAVGVRYCGQFHVDTAVTVHEYPVENKIRASQLLRMKDRILVFGDYNMAYIYSYPELKYLGQQELPGRSRSVSDDGKLYCESQGEVEVFVLTEQDSLCHDSSFRITAKVPFSIGSVQQLHPDVFIYPDMYDFLGKKEFHIMNTKTNQRISKGEYPDDDKRFKKLQDFKVAYMHGLRVKPDKSAFVVTYSLLRRVRIYNKEGDLQHDIFLENAPGNYKEVPIKQSKRYWHFGQTFVTDNYIYILNPDKLGQAPNEPRCNILVLDWEGNLITRYRFNVWIYDFFVDEENHLIFGGCAGGEKGNSFFRTNMISNNVK